MTDPLSPYAPPADGSVVPPLETWRPLTPGAIPRLRPLLAEAAAVFRSRLSTILVIVLLVYVPIDLVLEALPDSGGDDFRSLARSFRVQRTLEFFFGVLCTMAIAHLVQGARNGVVLSVGDCFAEAASRWRASLWAQFLVNVALIGGLLALVFPVFFVAVATAFTIFFVALRGLSGVDAITASWGLVKGRFWEVFRLFTLIVLTEIVLVVVLSVPLIFLPEQYLISVAHSLLVDVVAAFFLVAGALLFLQLEGQGPASRSTPDQESPAPLVRLGP